MVVEILRKVELTDEDVKDIVVTALEGGVGYWACLDNTGAEFSEAPGDEAVSETVGRLLLEGKTVWFCDAEDEGEVFSLTLEKLKKGIGLFVTEGYDIYGAFDGDKVDMFDIDADRADIIFQLAMLGDIVYG